MLFQKFVSFKILSIQSLLFLLGTGFILCLAGNSHARKASSPHALVDEVKASVSIDHSTGQTDSLTAGLHDNHLGISGEEHEPHNETTGHRSIGEQLPLWTVIPFVGILMSIALFPLFSPRWWHQHFPKVSAFWAIIFAAPFLFVFRGDGIHFILHTYLIEYFPFIILLWALFTVSGGLHVKGRLQGSPGLNLLFLFIGTMLASWMGTTGASMILIRPLIRANAWRKAKTHLVVFFIFLVSNIGGSLTPLGDPPLFLGFLHWVPFFWTFNLLPHMGFCVLILFVMFYYLDCYYYKKEEKPETFEKEPVRIEGAHNLLFLLGIIVAVLMSGLWRGGLVNAFGISMRIEFIARDVIMLLMGLFSLKTTADRIHKENEFTWFPIKEVAFLFAGIFMTIIPVIQILKAGGEGDLSFVMDRLKEPVHYFWITGILSSFLDNAPTYLSSFNTALGAFFAGIAEHDAVGMLIAQKAAYLKAISAGAVFMGANTYIGNAPNFMVRSIAEEAGIKMPSFFGYMFKYSLPILIPIFIMVTLVFFL